MAGSEAVWFNRGAVALALIVWPVTAYLWDRGVGWKALAIPIALGIGSAFLESGSATLGFAVGVATVLLTVAVPRAGRTVSIAAIVLAFVAMPFAAREMYRHGWHRADWLIGSARHRVEIWDFTLQRIAEKPLLGWGFDAARHLQTSYPETGATGRTLAALHPHSVPLQILLELGAVGAVVTIGLLCLVAMRLDEVSGRARAFGQAALVAALAMGTVAYGAWQNWWLALIVSVALLVPLVAAPGAQEWRYSRAPSHGLRLTRPFRFSNVVGGEAKRSPHSLTNQNHVALTGARVFPVASGRSTARPVAFPRAVPGVFGDDRSGEKMVRSVPQEGIQDAVLESLDIDLDRVDAFEPPRRGDIQQGPKLDVDRPVAGNPRRAQVFHALRQLGHAVAVADGATQDVNAAGSIQSDVEFEALPHAGVRLDRNDLPAVPHRRPHGQSRSA